MIGDLSVGKHIEAWKMRQAFPACGMSFSRVRIAGAQSYSVLVHLHSHNPTVAQRDALLAEAASHTLSVLMLVPVSLSPMPLHSGDTNTMAYGPIADQS